MHSIHDFTAKLRQPRCASHVERYVQWRRAVARRAPPASRSRRRPPSRRSRSTSISRPPATTAATTASTGTSSTPSTGTTRTTLRASIGTMAERGLRSVILIGGGEPTIYPGFADFVRFLKELELQVAVVSNGSRGDRLLEVADVLDERDWVRLSLDSGSNELFRAMHKPVNRSRSRSTRSARGSRRSRQRNPALQLGFSYIIVWRRRVARRRRDPREHPRDRDGRRARAALRLRLHLAQARPRAPARTAPR